MPYCKTTFHLGDTQCPKLILSTLTRECFVGGRNAYDLGHNRYAIDAGENDIRAIYDEEHNVVRFFCRYKTDLPKYEKKLKTFAINHGIEITD